ncbi:MAG: LamB/YcsF family protein [Cognatishimia sp.]|uniref:LamB/YcsF family protein n=1 Tax=Cognatishimia sp. TaxID=2211648 RepID=UPI0040584006
MTLTVDLNADMGESFGPWPMGNDAALLNIVTSANVACGFHAGDADTMAQTMALAQAAKVNIGAHPGFADLQGFGRRRMNLSPQELENLVIYQLGTARSMAAAQGASLRHLKLHGALANMCSEDEDMATTCYRAALRAMPDITIMAMAATAQERAVRALSCDWVGEIFADRAYEEDGRLVDRKKPGALIHDANLAAERVVQMVNEQAIITAQGTRIPTKVDTVCLHGDGETAVQIANALRRDLEAAGVEIRPF